MKQLRLFLTAALLFIIAACSSDSNSDTGGSGISELRLKKTISSDGTITNYIFSGSKLAGVETSYFDGETFASEFVYEGSKVVRIKYFNNGVYRTGEDVTYTYNGDNIVSSQNIEDGIVFSKEYDYSSGIVTEERLYEDGELAYTTNYTYGGGGNLINLNSDSGANITYSYDDKKNPLYYIMPAALAKIEPTPRNNVLSSSGGTTYQYQYNSQGYPISKSGGFQDVTYEYETLN